MPDYVTLAHDNTKSGSWEPAKNPSYDDYLDRFRKAMEDFEYAMASGDQDQARDISEMLYSVYGYHAYNDALDDVHDAYDDALDDGYVDIRESSDHTRKMNDFTRDELNAKLETIEVKMDARVESVSSKIDGFLSAQSERDKRLDAALAQISKDHGETKAGISSMKTTLLVTAVTTVIAIVLGIAGFNTALTSNMLSAFQAGKTEQSAPSTAPAVSPTQPSSPGATPKS